VPWNTVRAVGIRADRTLAAADPRTAEALRGPPAHDRALPPAHRPLLRALPRARPKKTRKFSLNLRRASPRPAPSATVRAQQQEDGGSDRSARKRKRKKRRRPHDFNTHAHPLGDLIRIEHDPPRRRHRFRARDFPRYGTEFARAKILVVRFILRGRLVRRSAWTQTEKPPLPLAELRRIPVAESRLPGATQPHKSDRLRMWAGLPAPRTPYQKKCNPQTAAATKPSTADRAVCAAFLHECRGRAALHDDLSCRRRRLMMTPCERR